MACSLGEEGRATYLYKEGLALHQELGNEGGVSRALKRLDAER